LDKLARSASDLFNVHKLPVTHYRLHKTLQKNPGIAGMVKNSHIRKGVRLSSMPGMSALALVLHSQKGNNP